MIPQIVIKPKVQGQGVVLKKDGTVSVPAKPPEKDNGRNPDHRSA